MRRVGGCLADAGCARLLRSSGGKTRGFRRERRQHVGRICKRRQALNAGSGAVRCTFWVLGELLFSSPFRICKSGSWFERGGWVSTLFQGLSRLGSHALEAHKMISLEVNYGRTRWRVRATSMNNISFLKMVCMDVCHSPREKWWLVLGLEADAFWFVGAPDRQVRFRTSLVLGTSSALYKVPVGVSFSICLNSRSFACTCCNTTLELICPVSCSRQDQRQPWPEFIIIVVQHVWLPVFPFSLHCPVSSVSTWQMWNVSSYNSKFA